VECVELQTKLSDLKQGIFGCHAHQSTYETRQRLKGLGGRPTGFIRLASERISCSMIFPPEATYLADLSTSRTASSLLTLISLVSVSFFSHSHFLILRAERKHVEPCEEQCRSFDKNPNRSNRTSFSRTLPEETTDMRSSRCRRGKRNMSRTRILAVESAK
jgi:hypothetical protein